MAKNLVVLAAALLAACGGNGSSSTSTGGAAGSSSGGSSGGGTTGSAVPLQLDTNYNLAAFVDSQGTYSNIQHQRIAAFGGSPDPARGYSWTYSLGDGLPSTIDVDPNTGLFEGTLSNTFVPGAPGVDDVGDFIYPVTITVSDGISSVSSSSCAVLTGPSATCAPRTGEDDIRLFISLCNSSSGAQFCAQGGSSATPYPQGPPLQGIGINDTQGTVDTPVDLSTAQGRTATQVNRPFGFALSFGGGTPPYTFQVSSGALPPGLILTSASGELLGTPTSAALGNTYPFAVTLSDGAGNSSTYHYTFTRFAE